MSFLTFLFCFLYSFCPLFFSCISLSSSTPSLYLYFLPSMCPSFFPFLFLHSFTHSSLICFSLVFLSSPPSRCVFLIDPSSQLLTCVVSTHQLSLLTKSKQRCPFPQTAGTSCALGVAVRVMPSSAGNRQPNAGLHLKMGQNLFCAIPQKYLHQFTQSISSGNKTFSTSDQIHLGVGTD